MNRPGIDVGDCFEAAIAAALEAHNEGRRALVCHGKPIGRGEHNNGIRFWHGWAEIKCAGGWYVLDWSGGMRRSQISRGRYYRMGRLQGQTIDRYSLHDVAQLVKQHDHVGPWKRYEEGQI